MQQPLDTMRVIPGGGFRDPVYTKRWGFVHNAADYFAEFVPVYAHLDCEVVQQIWGREGGNWLLYKDINGYTIRAAHHKEYKTGLGKQKEGTIIAITGNTGTHRDGTPNSPHWHCEVKNPFNQYVDPEWYFNSLKEKPMDYNNSIIRNQDTGGFYFFKKSKNFDMARQPLSYRTVGFALLTLKQAWKDKDYEHIYQMTDKDIKKYAVVWEFFGGESEEYKDKF